MENEKYSINEFIYYLEKDINLNEKKFTKEEIISNIAWAIIDFLS